MSPSSQPSGILLVYKPSGITSFSLLGPIKKYLGTRKIGHTGTLDKFASGLMIVLVGRYTKMNDHIMGMDKTYEAEITLGKETETLDPEGEVIHESPLPDRINYGSLCRHFTGNQKQVPPLYSALHVDGKRAYQRVRSGEEFSLPPRNITINHIEVLQEGIPSFTLRLECSKGTYVRSLARDMGRFLGTRGYCSALKRVRIGPVSLGQAQRPSEIEAQPRLYGLKDLPGIFPHIQTCQANESGRRAIRYGQLLGEKHFESPPQEGLVLAMKGERELALLQWKGGQGRYKVILEASP